jgi:hypothetical protein
LPFLNSNNIYNYFIQYDIMYADVMTCYTYDGTEPFSTNKITYERVDTLPNSYVMFQGKRSHYFKETFPLLETWKRFGHKNREWMFDFAKVSNKATERQRPHRPFFNGFEEFKNYITSDARDIIGVHVGGLFEEQNNKSKLLRFNFVLDCDIPEWKDEEGPLRLCCGNGKHLCKNCWPIIALAFHVLKVLLEDLMGLKNNEFYFSGSKGIHVWIDPDNEKLHSVVDVFKRTKFYNLFSIYSDWKAGKILNYDKQNQNAKEKGKTQEFGNIKACIEKIKSNDQLRKPLDISDKEILKMYWPRIDHLPFQNVGMNRMIRCPNSLHSSTNRKVEKLTDPVEFFEGFYEITKSKVYNYLGHGGE